MSKAWRGGSTRRWRRIRAEVLPRDGWKCQIALADVCEGTADQVHHVGGRAVTGDDPRYCVAACGPCNRKLGDVTTSNPKIVKREDW